MVPPKYTLIQCISKVFSMMIKYPFSIFLLILILFTIFTIVSSKRINSQAPKIITILSWILVAFFMGIKYIQSVKFLHLTLKSGTFSSIYFPNVITYLVMIVLSFFLFFRSIIKKEKSLILRLINSVAFGVIGVNFILILRELFKNDITIYDPLTIYKYEGLQVLIQTSTWVFIFWLIALLINYVAKITTKKLDALAAKKNVTR